MPPQTFDDNATAFVDVHSADPSSGNAFEIAIADVSKESHATLFDEEAFHDPKPIISRRSVLSIGFFIFILAAVWPPLILLLAYLSSILIPYCYRENDEASTRRQLLHKFDKEDDISSVRRVVPDNVEIVHGYWTNPRGLLLHYTILTPKDQSVNAVVCHCHGYTDTPTFTRRNELTYMVQHGGLAVIMVDYEGHGRSDGPLALIKKWDVLVSDVHNFFQEMTRKEFPGKKLFLLGESMGGAVAYTIIKENPAPYGGVIFMSPMCKVAADMMPPQWVVDTLRKLIGPSGTVTPFAYLPIAPSRGDLRAFTYKLPYRRALFTRCPSNFARKPRLATASELLNATKKISESLSEFEAPFLVVHGKADRVTDPMLSQALYNEAKSEDKTIRLYEDMWHSLTSGEPQQNVEIVLKDSIQWILDRIECGNNKKHK